MRLICALSIAFALGATPAFADDPPKYEPKIIPKCTLAGDVCGYTLGEWTLVLDADAELVAKRALLAKEKDRTAALTLQVKGLKSQVGVYADSQKLLVAQVDKVTTELIDTDKKYQFERVKPRWGSPVAWTIAAVAVAVLAGFVVKDTLE